MLGHCLPFSNTSLLLQGPTPLPSELSGRSVLLTPPPKSLIHPLSPSICEGAKRGLSTRKFGKGQPRAVHLHLAYLGRHLFVLPETQVCPNLQPMAHPTVPGEKPGLVLGHSILFKSERWCLIYVKDKVRLGLRLTLGNTRGAQQPGQPL